MGVRVLPGSQKAQFWLGFCDFRGQEVYPEQRRFVGEMFGKSSRDHNKKTHRCKWVFLLYRFCCKFKMYCGISSTMIRFAKANLISLSIVGQFPDIIICDYLACSTSGISSFGSIRKNFTHSSYLAKIA